MADRFKVGDTIMYEGFGYKHGPHKLVAKCQNINGGYISETGSIHLVNALAYSKYENNASR